MTDSGDKGLVFNIQRFSVHDGPGIRTTVFFKGCPLRCLWCSNPESQDYRQTLIVRDMTCTACGKCVAVCPLKAISIDENSGRRIDWSKCNQCLRCVEACMYSSLNRCGDYMTVAEIIKEVARDTLFYKNSGGGVTISGGEPLLQHAFLMKLLPVCKDSGYHVALDTTGFASREVIKSILPYVDLVLFDIKHLDDETHRKLTGVGNKAILSNLREVAKASNIWLRVPLIEGLNDSAEEIEKIGKLAKAVGAEKVSLLPYHEGGVSKSYQIGREYLIPKAKPPSAQYIESLKCLLLKMGVKATVGS